VKREAHSARKPLPRIVAERALAAKGKGRRSVLAYIVNHAKAGILKLRAARRQRSSASIRDHASPDRINRADRRGGGPLQTETAKPSLNLNSMLYTSQEIR
jgi:hypothetical protein